METLDDGQRNHASLSLIYYKGNANKLPKGKLYVGKSKE